MRKRKLHCTFRHTYIISISLPSTIHAFSVFHQKRVEFGKRLTSARLEFLLLSLKTASGGEQASSTQLFSSAHHKSWHEGAGERLQRSAYQKEGNNFLWIQGTATAATRIISVSVSELSVTFCSAGTRDLFLGQEFLMSNKCHCRKKGTVASTG